MRKSIVLTSVQVFLFWGILFAPAGFAQQRSVELTAPPARSAFPGEIVTLVFLAKNRGTLNDIYDFRLDASQGLQLVSATSPASVPAGMQEPIFVSFFVLPDASASDAFVTLEATSRGDPTVKTSARAQITIQAVTGVDVRPPAAQEVEMGTEAILPFVVVNRGNIIDTFRLEATSRRAFPTTVEPSLVALLPGASRSVLVTVKVPVNADPGPEAITLMATSLSRSGVGGKGTAVLTILPPLPEKVPTDLSLKSPTEMGFAINFDPTDNKITPQFSLLTDASLPGDQGFSVRFKISLEAETLGQNVQEFAYTSRVGSYALQLQLGDISQLPLQDVALPTRGLEFSVTDLAAFSATFADMKQLAYGLSLFGPMGIRAGFAHLLINAPSIHNVVGARFESSVMEAEGAVDQTPSALLHMITVRVAPQWDNLTPGFEFSRVEPNFPSAQVPADTQTWSLFADARLGAFSLRALISGSHTDLFNDPLVQAISTLTFQVALTVDNLFPGLPTSFFELMSVAQHGDEPPPLSTNQRVLTAMFSDLSGPIAYSVTVTDTAFSDNIASVGTHTSQLHTFVTARRLLGIEGLAISVSVSGNLKTDISSRAVLEQSLNMITALSFSMPGVSVSLGVGLDNGAPVEENSLFFSRGMFDFSLSTSFKVPSSVGISAEMRTRFALPFESILVRGRVEGFIFIDQNGNSQRDPNESGVAGALLRINDQLARTDEQGFFRFPPLEPGTYRLEISRLPVGLIPQIALPLNVAVAVGQVVSANIPVKTVAIIGGRVFNDANRNGKADLSETGVAGVRVVASGPITVEARTNNDGQYALQVDPGTYTINLDPTTLPRRFAATTPASVTVAVQVGQRANVDFGVAEAPRPVLVAPTAEFTFTPTQPHVGERVVFDASASQAVDGEIVSYEWDFDGDGQTDETGRIVEHIFRTAGDFTVRLTVMDSHEQKNSVTQVVPVQP
ncbi:PKD domain-containing protein [Candidatus Acetothermia bacterium]|nr:PKD domain-containing protein [Candidatus Acetothermia bacterium]